MGTWSWRSLAALACLTLAPSCSGGDGGSGDAAPASRCEAIAERICPEACACADCWLRATSDTQGVMRVRYGGGCVEGFVADVCGDPTKPAALFDACLGQLEAEPASAACMEEDGDTYYFLPEGCHGLLDCEAGPCLN
jgi:hypothetical protein